MDWKSLLESNFLFIDSWGFILNLSSKSTRSRCTCAFCFNRSVLTISLSQVMISQAVLANLSKGKRVIGAKCGFPIAQMKFALHHVLHTISTGCLKIWYVYLMKQMLCTYFYQRDSFFCLQWVCCQLFWFTCLIYSRRVLISVTVLATQRNRDTSVWSLYLMKMSML